MYDRHYHFFLSMVSIRKSVQLYGFRAVIIIDHSDKDCHYFIYLAKRSKSYKKSWFIYFDASNVRNVHYRGVFRIALVDN